MILGPRKTNIKEQRWAMLKDLTPHLKYKYPGADLPRKNLGEGKTLQKLLPKDHKGIFLDYGCGEGSMFKYIKQCYKRYPPLIVGVDPDLPRLNKAKRVLLKDGGKGFFLNTTFDNSVFWERNLQESILCIICIQVFGHILEYRLNNALRLFHFLLKPKGVLIVAFPVINNGFSFPGWKAGNDFLSLTDFRRDFKDLNHKIILSRKDFSYLTDHPSPNLLPTRYFIINEKIKLNHTCDKDKMINSKLGRNFKRYGFAIKNAIIYNTKPRKGSGDLMISFIKKREGSRHRPGHRYLYHLPYYQSPPRQDLGRVRRKE